MKLGMAWSAAAVLVAGLASTAASPLEAQLDATCMVSAFNRTAPVKADGVWVLPSVPAGVGQTRIRATCVADGVVRSGSSGLLSPPPGGVIQVDDIDFAAPPAVPATLSLSARSVLLHAAGETVQLAAVARLADGTTADVTAAVAGTDYRSSNPVVATVDANGLVTAHGSGVVLLNAANEGALSLLVVRVVLAGDSDADGLPDDWELAHGLDPGNSADALSDSDVDGLDALREYQAGTDPQAADSDGDGLEDGEEVQLVHTDPLRWDTDGDGLSDALEVATGSDPLDPASFNLAAALTGFAVTPSPLALSSNTLLGGGSRQLRVIGQLLDGRTLDITARRYGTTYASSDLLIANFGGDDGRVYAGNSGVATVTVSNGAYSMPVQTTVESVQPGPLGLVRIPGYGNAIAVAGDYAFIAAGAPGVVVVDVSVSTQPFIVGSLDTPGNANDIRIVGDLAFVADGVAGLAILDIGDPRSLRLLGEVATPGPATDVAVSGSFAYVADQTGLRVIDVTGPSTPLLVGGLDIAGGAAVGVDIRGSTAVVAVRQGGVVVVDVSVPGAPAVIGRVQTRVNEPSHAQDVLFADDLLLVADGSPWVGGVVVVDMSIPTSPRVTGRAISPMGVTSVAFERGLAFGADHALSNTVPILSDLSGRISLLALVSFALPPEFRLDACSGIAVRDGIIFKVGDRQRGGYWLDNGVTGDSALTIGRYADYSDDGGIAPTIEITEPAEGSSFFERLPIHLAVSAADDVRVGSVDFIVNGQRVATDYAPPFEASYTPPLGSPDLEVVAVAKDDQGTATASAPVHVATPTYPAATARLLMPYDFYPAVIGAVVPLSAEASAGLRPVARVDFVINGAVVGTVAAPPYAVAYTVPEGSALLTVEAIAYDDLSQASVPARARIVVDLDRPPSALILAPQDGAELVRGSVHPFLAGVADDVAVTAVDFFVNGIREVTRTAPPWEWTFRSPPLGEELPLEIVVHDTAGHTTTASVTVTSVPDALTSIHGRVVARDRTPLSGVSVLENSTSTETASDFAGEFILGVSSEPFALSVSATTTIGAASYAAQTDSFTPAPGLTLELGDLVLLPGAGALTTAIGRVVDQASAVVPAADVHCRGVAGLTGPQGEFAVSDVPAAANVVCTASYRDAEGQGFSAASASVVPVIGGTTNMGTLTLLPDVLELYPGPQVRVGHATFGIAAADLNGDGRLDLVAGNQEVPNSGGDETVSVLLGEPGGTLGPPATYSASFAASSLTLADVNGDGHPDAVMRNDFYPAAVILLGNSEGTFGEALDVPLSEFVVGLAAGDLDADGYADLVVGGQGQTDVWLGAGDGTFAQGQVLPFAGASSVLLHDMDGNGSRDLLLGRDSFDEEMPDSDVPFYSGNGDGTFTYVGNAASGVDPSSLAAADLDGDGSHDLLVGDMARNRVEIYHADGGGSFSHTGSLAVGGDSTRLLAKDLDGDGAADLVALVRKDNSGSLVLAKGRGDGTFNPELVLPASGSSSDVLAADLDGDGRMDLAVAEYSAGAVTVYASTQPFAFDTRVSLPRSAPVAPTLLDLNGDEALDLVYASRSDAGVKVELGHGDATFAPAIAYPSIAGARDFILLDVNGDERPDAVAADESGELSVLFGEEGGTFAAETRQTIVGCPSALAGGDLNRDGFGDLAVDVRCGTELDQVAIYLGSASGALTFVTRFGGFERVQDVAIADFDGDGKLDVAVSSEEGGGVFIVAQAPKASRPSRRGVRERLPAAPAPVHPKSGGEAQVTIFLGGGDGTFGDTTSLGGGETTYGLCAADFDRDGILDIAAGVGSGIGIGIGRGDGTFVEATYAAGLVPDALSGADVSGDGIPDLVAAGASTGNVAVLIGRGDGSFLAPQLYAADGCPAGVAIGDLDGDGRADLLTASSCSDEISILLHAGLDTTSAGTATSSSSFTVTPFQAPLMAPRDGVRVGE